MFDDVFSFVRSLFPGQDVIPLHAPQFIGQEKKYVNDAIDSTFVSSVGEYVSRFEAEICRYTGAAYAVATVNGTAALQAALHIAGARPGDEVITQPLTFIATANAISCCGAQPVFLDVERQTLGLSPTALESFLTSQTLQKDNQCYNRQTGNKIAACVPMHTFGHPCQIDLIVAICNKYNIPVIEDAAEALGSLYKNRQAGTFGLLGTYSFNGNKTITCGGGGIIVTNDENLAKKARHLTTTAKISHPYLYQHDEVGFNFRMPNLNAALACAQLENLERFIDNKRDLAARYRDFFQQYPDIAFVSEPDHCRSNYWLNAIIMPDLATRNHFLEASITAKIMTRPAWDLITHQKPYRKCQSAGIPNAEWLVERIINLPSSVRL